ncbi:MAG: hypothetical protein J5651_09735 [Salinivirgaceae bacterium]|nr:hypothetical protein [Salinivirgaceae bacterium]
MKKILTLLFVCSSLFSSSKTIWVCDNSITYSGEKNSVKKVYEYDSIGNKTQEVTYLWMNENWEVSQTTIYEYENGRETQHITYGGGKTKCVYEYDGNGNITELIYLWKNGEWNYYIKRFYEYDINKNVVQCIEYRWKNDWEEYQKTVYEYENGRETQHITYGGGRTKCVYEYDGNGNKTELTYLWKDDKWDYFIKRIYGYNDNGNLVQYIQYTWSDGWTSSQKTVYEYKSITIEFDDNTNSEDNNRENQGGNNEGGNNEGGNNEGGNNEGGNGNNPATAIADDAASAVNIYASGNTIVVENATEEIRIYDVMGKLVCRDAINRVRTEIPVNTTGLYIVKTGGMVKRVMVN